MTILTDVGRISTPRREGKFPPWLDSDGKAGVEPPGMRPAWGLLLLALATSAHAEVVLEQITVSGSTVRVRLSAPIVAAARPLPAAGDLPDRVYLDLPGVALGDNPREITAAATPLERVRTGQFDPHTTRVVLDLDHPPALR